MANPILQVYLSHAPDGPEWALDGVVDILRRLQGTRGKPYELRYGYTGGRTVEAPLPIGRPPAPAGAVTLADADLVFVLVTRAYFKSAYVSEVERPLLEERLADEGYAGVFPILVEPEAYAYSWLEAHQPRTIILGATAAAGADSRALYGVEQWLTAAEKISERLLGLAAVRR